MNTSASAAEITTAEAGTWVVGGAAVPFLLTGSPADATMCTKQNT